MQYTPYIMWTTSCDVFTDIPVAPFTNMLYI